MSSPEARDLRCTLASVWGHGANTQQRRSSRSTSSSVAAAAAAVTAVHSDITGNAITSTSNGGGQLAAYLCTGYVAVVYNALVRKPAMRSDRDSRCRWWCECCRTCRCSCVGFSCVPSLPMLAVSPCPATGGAGVVSCGCWVMHVVSTRLLTCSCGCTTEQAGCVEGQPLNQVTVVLDSFSEAQRCGKLQRSGSHCRL